ncbi:hypothetical protein GDO86_012298 [Hymenochirus boettgeri]|uniref:Immunoglobulin V-set domain-containing protein n=1 Tax=Hymenochirus boettgeri TaxID=247094 RepID=A0A8T2IS44_9PIPI|nr:hypothetical protein GDO86_012298 [Hymenochirus boettgeri]
MYRTVMAGGPSWIVSFVTAFCIFWMGLAKGINITLVPPSPGLEQPVLLNVDGIGVNLRSYAWYRGLNPNADDQILSYIPSANPPQTKGGKYFPEAQGQANGSLLITSFKKEHEGDYTIQAQTDSVQQTNVHLFISAKPTNPPTIHPPHQPDNWKLLVAVLVPIAVVICIILGVILYTKCKHIGLKIQTGVPNEGTAPAYKIASKGDNEIPL